MKKIFKTAISFCLILVSCFMITACGNNNIQNNTQSTYVVSAHTRKGLGNIYGTGTYYKDQEIKINAVPAAGYEFDYWEDDDTHSVGAVRTIKVESNVDYFAIFREIESEPVAEHYALDKIEVYVVGEPEAVKAKSVCFMGLKVMPKGGSYISEFNFGDVIVPDTGIKMVMYNVSTTNILVTSAKPIYFYSKHSDENNFIAGTDLSFLLFLTYDCSSVYYDTNDDELKVDNNYYGNKFVSHTPTERSELKFTINSETTKTVVLADETAEHGFKIMARLNFVKL